MDLYYHGNERGDEITFENFDYYAENNNSIMNTEGICEQLQSSERRIKIAALQQLQHYCKLPSLSSTQVLTTLNESYLHILKCYSDRYERVRSEAALTINLYIEKLPPNDFHTLNVISTLTERIGIQETIEESEEIRLIYLAQLSALVQKYVSNGKVRSLEESYFDITKILLKALGDPFPAVQRESCECIIKLAIAVDTYAFQKWAEKLTKPLYLMLNHKHSQSRIAAVRALTRLALHINPNTNSLSELFMEVSPLLMDSMPLVRRECGLMGITMLLELRDRYSYFDRIIPLVLCCLKDETPDVCYHIQPLWINCGKLYYSENEVELNKQDLVDVQAKNYPEGVKRPHIGCRALVQRSLRLLKSITVESTDWKDNVRLHSLKILYQFVLHAEAAMTAKFCEIYPYVARACCDVQVDVANEAVKVADLMGRLFSYDDWYEHGFDGLSKNLKEGYLKCLYYMLKATIGGKNEDLLRLSFILTQSSFSQSIKPEFQLYVIKIIRIIIEKSISLTKSPELMSECNKSFDTSDLYKNLYTATIKTMALCLNHEHENSQNLQENATYILETIAQCKGVQIAELHEEFLPDVLPYVEQLDTSLDSLSEPILLLHGLLSICKFRVSYINILQSKINEVWQNCTDDAKIKIFGTISIAMLSWHETVSLEVPESSKLLLDFVQSVVQQHLVWKAGSNAEVMRSFAAATLCAIAHGPTAEARFVMPAMAKYFPNLLEDQSATTRSYALKCLNNFGEVKMEELKPIAYAALQRLDDPSAPIRELAASVIPKLTPKFKDNEDKNTHDYQTWKIFICKALELLFLHFEGPEVRLNAAIKASLLQLAVQYIDDFKEYFHRANAMAYDNSFLIELRNELPFEV